MIRAFKVLIRPYGSFVDLFGEVIEKGVLVHVPVVPQYDQGLFVDVLMDLAFSPYDYFLNGFKNPNTNFKIL